ncbi:MULTISPECIES: ATP-binding protein [unclassified Massilia]|uniref:hybrid sensor histidine kinase/response regulator n=1 Tax=unclassified Massilia TaxID=2609279 RepID=UPI0017806064|nr:PAS domain-containing protein [Massilia sp. CFBP 13647]MBD8671766.1 PAS domain-containing protein [Massilia sp. CFBP 13721]
MKEQAHPDAFLDNGGRLGRRIRDRDWSGHPLGPIAGWDAALRTSLGIILNSAFPTFLAWGEDLTLFFNDPYEPMLGKKADSLGAPYRAVWHEVWDTLGPYVRRVLDGESFFFEDYAITLERYGYPEPAWFTFSYSPLRDERGSVRGMLCTCVDVTGKVLALARHKEAEERLALSLEASGNIGTWSYDLDDGTTYVDERFARLFQVDAALALSGTELERFTDMIHPQDRARVVAAIADAIRDDTRYDIDYRIPQRSGLDVWVNARGKVFADPVSGGRRFAGIAVDITARKEAEAARSASEERAAAATLRAEDALRRLDALFDAAPVGIAYADTDGRMLVANAADRAIWGEERPDSGVAGYGACRGWFPGDGTEPARALAPHDWPVARVLAGREADEAVIEIEPFGMPGVRRTILVRAQAMRDAGGALAGVVAVTRDIGEQVAAERALADNANELRAAARRKDEFLAMLAHELRNPLAPISNAARLLTMAGANEARIRKAGEVITRQVRHMTALVDDLLDVSRVTRGLVAVERKPVDVAAVVLGAVEQARPLIEARGHRFELDLADLEGLDGGARMLGDRTRLVQVLSNLLNNAAKYTPQGGNIALAAAVQDGAVAISVRDDGIGIGPEMLPHVFDLFSQAERTPDRSQGGLGLGLALVKSLVQLHGGRVGAHSAGAGRGSTFRVVFELVATGAPAAAPAAQHAMPASRQQRLLVVDDNTDAAQSLAEILGALGHRVATADGSRAALERAAAAWPDVFILDIGLPDIDGYALVRRLRALQDGRPTRYIALTGYGQAHDKVLARGAGFDHHFVKPVNLDALCAVLDDNASPGAVTSAATIPPSASTAPAAAPNAS